jgi:hypothetical protein
VVLKLASPAWAGTFFFSSKWCVQQGSEVEDAGELKRVTLKGRAIGEFFEELHPEVQSLLWKSEL